MPNLLNNSKAEGQFMSIQLVVLRPFQGFKRGDKIVDQALVTQILAGPQANFVVRVTGKES